MSEYHLHQCVFRQCEWRTVVSATGADILNDGYVTGDPHPDYDSNIELIALAPDMADAILKATSMKPSETTDEEFDEGWYAIESIGKHLRDVKDGAE